MEEVTGRRSRLDEEEEDRGGEGWGVRGEGHAEKRKREDEREEGREGGKDVGITEREERSTGSGEKELEVQEVERMDGWTG